MIPLYAKRLIEDRKKVGEPTPPIESVNLLALMFRRIKEDMNLTSYNMSSMMPKYLKDPRLNIKQTSKARSSEQSNLKRGLSNPGMTVKNFTKALRVIRPKLTRFVLRLQKNNGDVDEFVTEYTEDKLFSHFDNLTQPDNRNFLNELWAAIYQRAKLTEGKWRELVTQHLDDPNNGYDDGRNTKSSERSNLKRGLACPNMTIQNFTKALRVLNPPRIELQIEFEFEDGDWLVHMVEMEGSQLANSPFDEED